YSREVAPQSGAETEAGTDAADAEQAAQPDGGPAYGQPSGRVVPAYAMARGDRSTVATAGLQSARRERHIVRICVDSGKLATEWCPTTLPIDVTGRPMPTQYCRRHHAPAGEP